MADTTINRFCLAILVGALLAAAPLPAQDSDREQPAPAGSGQQEAATEPDEEAEEELPEIDVWAEDADTDDDVFIPTESISADSSIAFPADI